jgi:hypothetical protein
VGRTEADLTSNDIVPLHTTLLEYSARYQFRPRWAAHYSIMPVPEFDYVYQKVGLIYQPIKNCRAVVSLFNYWVFQDQKLTYEHEPYCGTTTETIDRTRNMVSSGIEIEKCVRTLCNGSTLSCDNKIGISYLDDTFGYDLQTGFRFTVPMNSGRWGYAKGGYRLIDYREDRPEFRLDQVMEGGFVEMGLIF